MSARKAKTTAAEAETAEEVKSVAEEVTAAAVTEEAAAAATEETTETEFPQVYCGPTVKGIAKQYTVYKTALPAAFVAFLVKYPLAKKLTVPYSRFAKTRKNIGAPGTAEYTIYKRLLRQLS